MIKSKKGLSPVIATSLLIAIALVLALIIFIWAKSFVGEVLQKNNEPIENSCGQVDFEADVSSSSVSLQNNGNVPLYGVELKTIGLGSVSGKNVLQRTLGNGEDTSIAVTSITLNSGDQVQVIPIIIGESGSGKRQYSCINNAKTITVA